MNISVSEVKERIDAKTPFHLIDVREEYEYEDSNIGGLLIPLGELPERLNEIEDLKNQEVVVMCRSGKRSENAQKFLEANGFGNVRNMIGGILAYAELED